MLALPIADTLLLGRVQVDAVVNSVNPQGFFAEVGPLSVFVSSHVSVPGF